MMSLGSSCAATLGVAVLVVIVLFSFSYSCKLGHGRVGHQGRSRPVFDGAMAALLGQSASKTRVNALMVPTSGRAANSDRGVSVRVGTAPTSERNCKSHQAPKARRRRA